MKKIDWNSPHTHTLTSNHLILIVLLLEIFISCLSVIDSKSGIDKLSTKFIRIREECTVKKFESLTRKFFRDSKIDRKEIDFMNQRHLLISLNVISIMTNKMIIWLKVWYTGQRLHWITILTRQKKKQL